MTHFSSEPKRRPDGAIDYSHYRARAARLRRDAKADAVDKMLALIRRRIGRMRMKRTSLDRADPARHATETSSF